MERNKRAQESRFSNKKSIEKPQDVIQNYVDHEILVLLSTIDAKVAMQNLMNDRGLLLERMGVLKCTVNKTEQVHNEMKQIEEDLAMRNTQIGDIQARVMETDIEAKIKLIPENFKTVPELKSAMGYLLRLLLDNREDYTESKTKAEDLKVSFETSEERIVHISEEMNRMMEQHEIEKSQLEREFEMKIAYLNSLFITTDEKIEKPDHNDQTAKGKQLYYNWIVNQMAAKTVEVHDWKAKAGKFEAELERLNSKKQKKQKQTNGTFTVDASEDDLMDSDDSFDDFDDSKNDPEWRKTPAGKRLKARPTLTLLKESFTKRIDGSGLLANISESSDNSSTKRSFNGEVRCKCKGSCATRLCKCKKATNFCNDNCQCSEACINLPDESPERDAGAAGTFEVEKENGEGSEVGDSPKRAK